MKKGTYIASTEMEGSVMFRIDKQPFTLRKGKDVEVEIKSERAKVTFPASYMSLTLKNEASKTNSETNSKSESKPEAKKEIKEEVKAEPKKAEPKVEEKAETKTPAKKPAIRGRKKTVKIETEEK